MPPKLTDVKYFNAYNTGNRLQKQKDTDMALFSGKLPVTDRDKKLFSDEEKNETEQSFGMPAIAVFALIYIVCFTFLLSFAYQAGKFMEFRIPLFLTEARLSLLVFNSAALAIAALSAFALELSLGIAHARTPLGRSRRLSYFFSTLATLGVAVYFGILMMHLLRGGSFLFESLYVFILFTAVFIPHFKAGKSPLAHMFVTAGFIVTLLVTAFYCGIGTAKIEDKLVTTVNAETYALAAVQNGRMILSGFDARTDRFTGKLLIKEIGSANDPSFTTVPSVRK